MSLIRVGDYRLGRTLGSGSFGKVKVAEHDPTQLKVAVKIINRRKMLTLDMGEKVKREIDALSLLVHQHIIRLYEIIETQRDVFVVMEFVPGGELFEYIVSRGRLSEDEARRFFQQIISGVEYCHAHNVVHRDLKPENLLLDSQRNVKIADFGLSNVMRDGDFLNTSCGSPNYAAPEVISGKLYAGPEVDVWSCGVILYALLCGSLPFDDEIIPNLFKKIRQAIYALPSHLSDGARDLIPRMLLVDPLKRISIQEIRQHPWFQKNLPPYLSLTPDAIKERSKIVDLECVEKVEKLKAGDRQTLLESLTKSERTNATVTYNLLVDHKRRYQQDTILVAQPPKRSETPPASSLCPNITSPTSRTPHPMAGWSRYTDIENLFHDSPGESVGSVADSPNSLITPAGQEELAAASRRLPKKAPSRRRWLLGMQSRLVPAQIMAEVFRALRAHKFGWRILGPFRLRCKLLEGLGPDLEVRIGIQVFKITDGLYLLDVQKLQGDTMPFMDMISKLLLTIKV